MLVRLLISTQASTRLLSLETDGVDMYFLWADYNTDYRRLCAVQLYLVQGIDLNIIRFHVAIICLSANGCIRSGGSLWARQWKHRCVLAGPRLSFLFSGPVIFGIIWPLPVRLVSLLRYHPFSIGRSSWISDGA